MIEQFVQIAAALLGIVAVYLAICAIGYVVTRRARGNDASRD